jgi:hypothetical protein
MPRKSVYKRKYKKGKRVTTRNRPSKSKSPVELDNKKLFDFYCDMRMRGMCKKK